MGFRWLGALLIIVSCTACGFSIAAGKRKEEHLLWQLLHTLQFMESELRYRLTPVPDLCNLAAGENKGHLGTIFSKLSHEMNQQKLPDAGSCMAAVLGNAAEIPASVRRILSQLGYTLGRFDLEGQLAGLQATGKRCEASLERIRKNRDEQIRCYQTLGICAGLALAIILV